MALKTKRFDVLEHLKTPEDYAAYLDAAMEDGDPAVIATALGDIARAKGMSAVAREAGVTREALYKALGGSGDPKLSTLVGVTRAIGVRLHAVEAKPGGASGRSVAKRAAGGSTRSRAQAPRQSRARGPDARAR